MTRMMSVLIICSSFLIFGGCGMGKKYMVDPSTISIPETGIATTATGLIKQVQSCPDGASVVAETQRCETADGTLSSPGPTSSVTVHYSGWTTDGVEFDSSVRRGAPATFPLNKVIKGWTEGLQTMVAGEKARLWIPEALAYEGKDGPPAGLLVFDVELISFE